MRVAIVLISMLPTLAFADVLPDLPEPDCDPGYIVQHDHGGVRCVRPSCRTDEDCPAGLGLYCPPGHCFRYVEDRECLEREGLGRRDHDFGSRNAFEPPPPCPPLQVREGPESCQTASDCGPGLNCTPRSCRPNPNAMSAMREPTAMSQMQQPEATRESESMDEKGCAVDAAPSWLGFMVLLLAARKRRNF